MLRKVLTGNYDIDQAQLMLNIYQSLEGIQQKLEDEISHKQAIIEICSNEIKTLRSQVVQKDEVIKELENKITEDQRSIEGNRQLINKLLNDLDRMQQSLEWYKRTYENRSLLGVIKDKLKHIIS
jgi:uncharacterized coiled-coil protein SlyX